MIVHHYGEDLFSVLNKPWGGKVLFAQCISADLAMGAGIAVQFNQYFNCKNILQDSYTANNRRPHVGTAILVNKRVFCLVTKDNHQDKPSYNSFRKSINAMVEIHENISFPIWYERYDYRYYHAYEDDRYDYLAIPEIGCGLDKLEWEKVEAIWKPRLKRRFKRIDVYHPKKNIVITG